MQGEYGISDLYCGIIAKIGSKGIEDVPELALLDYDKKLLHASADSIRELLEAMGE